jgi:hypothetical protein
MTGVVSGLSINKQRGFILECIEVYKSLPVLWDVNPSNIVTARKKKVHMQFFLINTKTDTQKQTERM